MNSQRGSSASGGSFNNYQFDFGLAGAGSGSSRPLRPSSKPSWTHQPAPSAAPRPTFANPSPSMVGDIFGKTWTSSSSSSSSSSGIGIPTSNPNLFSDLLGPALGSSRASSNTPLKSTKNSFSTGSLSDSLPKQTAPPSTTASAAAAAAPIRPSWGSAENLAGFGVSKGAGQGQPMRSAAGVAGSAMNSKKADPFGSLLDFGSMNSKNSSIASAKPKAPSTGGNGSGFGSFQTANPSKKDDFGTFQNANPPKPENFGIPPPSQKPAPAKAAGADPLDMFFSASAPAAPAPTEASGSEPFSELNDWDLGSEFGGNDSGGGTTTELEGLPPPPPGVSSSGAKTKGLDNYKQGQYADAIKWLSWAVALLEKSGDNASTIEVLSCRASCYKEVGEYKKAVADCSKVLENDGKNVAVLLQRALLYESIEKYRLGAEDLRMVLKIDPGNRLAKSTIHRLNKLAD
ncbi:nuclear envelope pore membrane protein POM 121 [Dioscorea cayenensis subsp. rotundata]|uniref:Nuclear envelope pore membrane protein POM 121 n=1 Tax=Dioscorea cayennensis subsp. rotundata TaxID=55577 RepID=A0AB40BQQ8_DIOCR|nr:nuclear envelope pore membrane protein POM 121 [Dioscorea cayenensis subsp. rotundata]